jgi:superfamily II DNA/RNA helicase
MGNKLVRYQCVHIIKHRRSLNISDLVHDVEDIRIVINLDYPAQTEDYVHRIGRTARSGAKGTAYSFFTRENAKQAPELIQLLKDSNQDVNEKLYEMSRSKYFGGGGGRGGNSYRGGFDRRGGGNSNRSGNSYNNNNNNSNARPTRFSNKRSRSRSPPARQSRFDNDYKRPRTDSSHPTHDEPPRQPYSSSTNGNGIHSQRLHQKSQPNGITVPPPSSSSSSTSNPYGGLYNQMTSYPPPSMYPPAYQMYAQSSSQQPPGPPPS